MINLSVMIITYNEEENIRQCLESVKWAGEIVVVDSFSTDQTLQISREFTDKVFERAWEGFGSQKQYALEQTTLDWVLSIDADERVSRELKEEILSNWNRLENDAYDIPFHFYWLGKRLRFSGYRKERHLRLFRRQKARFEGFVHEKLLIEGEEGHLRNPMIHLSYKDIGDYFDKFNLYSTMVARQKHETGRGALPFQLQIAGCLWDFFHRYVLQLGLLDGMPGFLWAAFSSFHRLVKYAKLWEMKRERREP